MTLDTDTVLITYQTAIHNYTMGDPIANYTLGKQMRTSCVWETKGKADVVRTVDREVMLVRQKRENLES